MELRTEPTEILSGGTPTDDASTDTVVEEFVENAQHAPEAVAGAMTEAVRTWADAVAA